MGPAKAEQRRLRFAAARWSHDPHNWVHHTVHHWGRWVEGGKLDYWPGTGKWMYDSHVQTGGLIEWLTARGEEL